MGRGNKINRDYPGPNPQASSPEARAQDDDGDDSEFRSMAEEIAQWRLQAEQQQHQQQQEQPFATSSSATEFVGHQPASQPYALESQPVPQPYVPQDPAVPQPELWQQQQEAVVQGGEEDSFSFSGECNPPATTTQLALCQDLEEWEELKSDGPYCTLCNKYSDGFHKNSEAHKKQLDTFLWRKRCQQAGAPFVPKQKWLVWAEDPENDTGLSLRCVMCNKWVVDWDDTPTTCYRGAHGDPGPENSKEHTSKISWLLEPGARLENEPWFQERLRWHPEEAGVASHSEALPESTELPFGWYEAKDEQGDSYYYDDEGKTQWERPTARSCC